MPESTLILIVDDDPRGRAALESTLATEGYRVEQAANGEEAIACARRLQPDVVLLDVMMPDMDGFDVCKVLRSDPRTAEVPIILVTALDDRDALLQGIDAGADELITKPFNRLELRTRLRSITHINRYRRLVNERKTLEETSHGMVTVLTDILSLSDPESFGRGQRVRERVTAIAEEMGLPASWSIGIAALLCRIGCMTVPASVQARISTGAALSPAEQSLVARVPEIGYRILGHLPQFAEVAEIVRWHDTRYDGGEQPDAVRGEALPVGARVLKVAMDLTELEAKGVPAAGAWAELASRHGGYDPAVLAAAERLVSRTPSDAAPQSEVREARLSQLRCGWRLHQDLLAPDGTLLLGSGHVISPVVLESIANFAVISGIKEPIMVEVPAVEAGPPVTRDAA